MCTVTRLELAIHLHPLDPISCSGGFSPASSCSEDDTLSTTPRLHLPLAHNVLSGQMRFSQAMVTLQSVHINARHSTHLQKCMFMKFYHIENMCRQIDMAQ